MKIHGKSTRTSKCPIFHQRCAFKLSISLYGPHKARLSSGFTPRASKVSNFQQDLLSGNPEPALRSKRDCSLKQVGKLQRLLLPYSMIGASPSILNSSCLNVTPPKKIQFPPSRPRQSPDAAPSRHTSPQTVINSLALIHRHCKCTPPRTPAWQTTNYPITFIFSHWTCWGRLWMWMCEGESVFVRGVVLGEGCITWAPSGTEWGISGKIIDELALVLPSSDGPCEINLNDIGGWWWVTCWSCGEFSVARRLRKRSEMWGDFLCPECLFTLRVNEGRCCRSVRTEKPGLHSWFQVS